MKFTEAKNYLESQNIEVGIGFFFTGKKLRDFGPLYTKTIEEFKSELKEGDPLLLAGLEKAYNGAKTLFEKDTVTKFEAEKEIRDLDVLLIFKQPTLDELMKISGSTKDFPSYLNTEIVDIARLAMEWEDTHSVTSMEQITNSLKVLEKCYIKDTFDGGTRTGKEIVDFLAQDRDLAMDVVGKFFASLGK